MTSFFYDLPYIRQTLGIDFDATGASLCCDKAAPGQDGKTPRGTPNYRTAADCVWTREMLGRYLWNPHNSGGTVTAGAVPFRAANGARTKKDENGNDKGCHIATAYDLADPTDATYTDAQGNTAIPPPKAGTVYKCLYMGGPFQVVADRDVDTQIAQSFDPASGFFYTIGYTVPCPRTLAEIWSYAGLSGIQNGLKTALQAWCQQRLATDVSAVEVYHHSILQNVETVTGPATGNPGNMSASERRDGDGELIEAQWDEFKLKVVPPVLYTRYYEDMVAPQLAGGATQSRGTGKSASYVLDANLTTPAISMRDFLGARWTQETAGESRSAQWCAGHVLSFTRPQDWLDLITQQ